MPLSTVTNPILPGFNPDPSIIRVGQDYYIATSTFEWFPGVQIHHSTDLVHWTLVTRPLNRVSQLDMRGVPDSGGVWAPCLSYCDGIYYLVYLFHDDDGRKWFLSMIVDHRYGKFFGGIVIQEYDPNLKRLIGKEKLIFEGSELGLTEGPHLYKLNGWYYLITAEGGTEYDHAVSMARSKDLFVPYELHPNKHVVTSKNDPEAYVQKTGHGDLVFAADGSCYLVCLASRPLAIRGRCTLGRETIMMPIEWEEDGWPYLQSGGQVAPNSFSIDSRTSKAEFKDESSFITDGKLNINFQSLRVPVTNDWLHIDSDREVVRIYGRQSLSSLHEQSLIARRVQSFHIQAICSIDFHPESFQHLAGLVCYYNTYHWYYLNISCNDSGRRVLQITSCDKYEISEALEYPIEIPQNRLIHLMVDFNRANIQFYYSLDGEGWLTVGPVLDGSILSDDYVQDAEVRYRPAFTGSFVGVACQDLRGFKHYADFHSWEYQELE